MHGKVFLQLFSCEFGERDSRKEEGRIFSSKQSAERCRERRDVVLAASNH